MTMEPERLEELRRTITRIIYPSNPDMGGREYYRLEGGNQRRVDAVIALFKDTMPKDQVVKMIGELDIAVADPGRFQKKTLGMSLEGWMQVARQKVLMKYDINA